jgi:hypothetical protein
MISDLDNFWISIRREETVEINILFIPVYIRTIVIAFIVWAFVTVGMVFWMRVVSPRRITTSADPMII